MKSILLLACTFMSLAGYSQRVEIPDKNFEQSLIDLKVDSDEVVNGYLLKSDAELITFLDVSNKKIQDLSGIEAFTALSYLDCRNNQLSNLDITHNIGFTILFTDVNDLINPNRSLMNMLWFN